MSDRNAATPGGDMPEVKRKRWPTVLLAASLTLNLLVAGVVVGAQFRDLRDFRGAPPPNRQALRDTGLAPFFDAMPREMRGRMSQMMRGQNGAMGPDRPVLAQEMRAMIAALKADPYDPDVLAALMQAQQQRAATRAETGRDLLVGQIASMSTQERAEFADELERLFNRALANQPPPPPPGGQGMQRGQMAPQN